jgi:transketolase
MTESKKIATRDAYGKALAELGAENDSIVALDADLSQSTKSVEFAKVFPVRFFNVGIAEANLVTVAAGMAAMGKIPFASSFAVFITGRAFEQIRNSVCYPKLNVKIVGSHAGITVGEDGGSHQAIADIALMRSLPNMTVLAPSDAVSTRWLVRAAAEYTGPVYLRLGRFPCPVIYDEGREFKWGQAELLRMGKDIVIFACGIMVAIALEAADLLAAEGISAAVADIHTIKPLDEEFILEMTSHCGAAITLEEHNIIGGLGSAVAEVLAGKTKAPFARCGIDDRFGQSGSPEALLKHYGLDTETVATRVKQVLSQKQA